MYSQDLSSSVPKRPRWAALIAVTGLALLALPSVDARATAIGPASVPAALAVASGDAPDDYTPPSGAKFNNPLNDNRSREISRHIRRSIASVPRGSKIRVFSWNIKSRVFENALIGAHNRGVSVRVLMSNGIAEGQDDQGSYRRLRHDLAQHQASRRPDMKSWARTCVNSCRGEAGAAHSKFFTFSQVGKRSDVVMVGSPNLTQAAALHQWNELITFANRPTLYDAFLDVFAEASRDKPVSPAFFSATEGDTSAWFTPVGSDRDPVLGILNKVRCQGASAGSGVRGATRVRIAADSMVGERGLKVAERIRTLSNWGCNVKLLYSVIGKRIAHTLFDKSGRGPVRAKHYVQDLDCDGAYDNYLHMKSIAISGHYGSETGAHIVLNGSNNWSAFGAASDDAGLIVDRQAIEDKYSDWIDHLWKTKPPYHVGDPCPEPTETTTTTTLTTLRVIDDAGWGPNHEALTPDTAWKYRNIVN